MTVLIDCVDGHADFFVSSVLTAFSVLILLVWHQEEHPARKKTQS